MPKKDYVKREEAEQRQVVRNKRTDEQQVELIATRRGNSKRELEKLRSRVKGV